MPTLAKILQHAETGRVDFSADWGQGRSIFGGALAAAALRHQRAQVEAGRSLRSLLVQFTGPVPPGPCALTSTILRAGRAATQVETKLSVDDEVRCVALSTYGAARSSSVNVDGPAPTPSLAPDELVPMPFVEGVVPVFTQHVDFRMTGEVPFTGAQRPVVSGHCRLKDDAGLDDGELVAVLVDAWPGPVLPLLDGPAPASSITWALHLSELGALDRAGYFTFESHAEAATAGYAQTAATLFAPDGRAVAFSTQSIAVFG